tara:strand:+ start:5075 stop:5521 length:447 start_codon:yes stop_codon:yes gene_type:complete
MIQFTRKQGSQFVLATLNIYDKMTNTDYRPLFTFKSQATGYTFAMMPFSTMYDNKERYVLNFFVVSSSFNPTMGSLNFGNIAAPYGFYDVTVYQNISNDNVLTTGLNVIYNGLANFNAQQTGDLKIPAVEYTDYNTNDSDSESVYITF